jgi:iron-sulfur cluster assembly accessory protein
MISITPKAKEMIKHFQIEMDKHDAALAIVVESKCCSNPSYTMDFQKTLSDSQIKHTVDGIKVFVEAIDEEFLEDATVDYIQSGSAEGFQISKPKKKSGCGCE